MFDVLVIGELNVDIIVDKIDGFPEIGKEKLADKFTITLGSSSAIFASNLSTLGTKVAFVGKIGKDSFGMLVKNSLKEKGVYSNLILETDKYQTGNTIILNYDMDRAMVTYPGAMEHLDVTDIPDDILSLSKHIHISSIFLQPKLKANLLSLFQRAKRLGLTISMDPQWDPAEKWDLNLEELLPYLDVFLPNRKELMYLTGTGSVQEGVEKISRFANIIAIKDGENGAHLWSDGNLITREAYLNSDVADCIGAGDSFDAGFISKYIAGERLEECLDFANISGAVNTTQAGGTAAFESMDAFKASAERLFSYSV